MNPLGLILIIATTLFPAYQLFALANVTDQIALSSQYLGLAALILMAWGQILSTRLRGIEAIFGGLDRVYVLHKWTGISAMVAILLHDTIDAEMRGLRRETALNDLAETLGEFSLYGLLILVVISVATFIPYHLWKWTHKAMGAMFAAGALHFFFIMKPFAMTDPAGVYTGLFCVLGLAAYAWMLLPETMRPSHGYKIASIEETGGATAITMQPEGRALRAQPGQFGVFRFVGAEMNEPHPFSFSSIGADGKLRVTIKALGDFTDDLTRAIAPGQTVRIQGPFGRFRLSGKGPEVWVAGGIGITPFLAWAQALPADAGPVDLFFCVKSRSTAPHLVELEEIAKAKPNLTLHLIAPHEGQRLSANVIAERVQGNLSGVKLSFCGPVALRKALQSGLGKYGVSARRFHFEEFEFRTGIGLKSLAAWVLRRTSAMRMTDRASQA
ncbi:ferric reductase-like transmembrane domain-containing protein [uncultured Tateyamaria sp.]|uniref:ferredoxin reductase family protein n=1 Tax=uncultured Tateyamaria sp. TaxID=455651 RepID=UPI002603DAFA|nr:ferric reductase-like transmembrane domain-containing protein [uncultured Tateyamaria sp.]